MRSISYRAHKKKGVTFLYVYLTNDSLAIGYRMHYNTLLSLVYYRVIYENWKIYHHEGYPREIMRCRECERSQEMKHTCEKMNELRK